MSQIDSFHLCGYCGKAIASITPLRILLLWVDFDLVFEILSLGQIVADLFAQESQQRYSLKIERPLLTKNAKRELPYRENAPALIFIFSS